jgi:hypothetical protein
MKLLGAPAAPAAHVDRRQDTPVHWHQVRCERDDHLPPGGKRKLLVELGHMPMMADAIRVKALRDFRKKHGFFRRAPCPGHAGLGIDDDLVEFNRLVLDERDERQLRAGRVAAGIGDQPCIPDLAPMNFGQTVNSLLLQLRRVMLVAIPFRIGRGVRQTKVCRQIDNFGRWRFRHQILDNLLRRRVRQGTKRNVQCGASPVDAIDRDKLRQRKGRELRKHVPHGLAGAALGSEQHNFGARVTQQHAHQLAPRVARGT